MAIDTFWLLENKIMYSKYTGDLRAQEICEEDHALVEMLQAGERPVHHLASGQEIEKYPMDLVKVIKCRTYLQQPELGWVVFYGANRLGKMMVNIVVGKYAGRIRAVDTYEQAIEFLLSVDDTLHSQAETLRQRTPDADPLKP